MTVSSTTNKSGPYLGNGSTVDFDYEFRILDPSHLTVIRTEDGVDTPVAPSDFTVSGVGASSGGALTFLVAPVTGQSITIIRNAPFTQPTDLENQGAYYAETVEAALDLGVMRDQQLAEGLSRAVQIPVGADAGALTGLIEDIVRLSDSADQIDTVAGIAANVTTVAGISANVTTVAGIAANVTTVAGIAGDVTNVADNIASVNTTATNIAAIIGAPEAAAAAIAAEEGAEAAQAAAEAAVGSVNLPPPVASTFLQRNIGNTAYEARTSVEVRDTLDTAPYVADRTALKALDTTKDTVAILKEAGREGVFIWKTGDFSARVTADAAEGVYVKANAIASASGAWVRLFDAAISIKWFGAVGDGATDCSAAVKAALALGSAYGFAVYAPAGNYRLNSTVNPTMSGDIEFICEAGANFVAHTGASAYVFYFQMDPVGTVSLRVRGGRFDVSNVPNGDVNHIGNIFYIGASEGGNMGNFDVVEFIGCEFYAGEDYEDDNGDSAIFCVADNFRAIQNRFQGFWDAGIYLSGNTSQINGEDALIQGNVFIKCAVAAISKRTFRRYNCSDNFIDRCAVGIAAAGADTTLMAGRENIISGNHIVQPKNAGIQIDECDDSIIVNNRIEDQGYDLTDAAVAVSTGILLRGSSDCLVSTNWIGMRKFSSPNDQHRGVYMQRHTYNAVNYDCLRNLIAQNRIVDVYQGVVEDANGDFNRVIFNMVTGATSSTVLVPGAGSFSADFDSTTQRRINFRGLVSLGGFFGQESFRVNENTTGQVDFLAAAAATGAPILQAIGASTNLDLRLIPKGTGVIRFGTHTTNADAAVNGYITIKDSAGTVRKLATIA